MKLFIIDQNSKWIFQLKHNKIYFDGKNSDENRKALGVTDSFGFYFSKPNPQEITALKSITDKYKNIVKGNSPEQWVNASEDTKTEVFDSEFERSYVTSSGEIYLSSDTSESKSSTQRKVQEILGRRSVVSQMQNSSKDYKFTENYFKNVSLIVKHLENILIWNW